MRCAKHVTACTIYTKDGLKIYGENYCLNPQEVCPREEGEGYEKCKTICKQVGHAEEVAIMKAVEMGIDVHGAAAVIGHKRVCCNCESILDLYDIKEITLTGMNYDK